MKLSVPTLALFLLASAAVAGAAGPVDKPVEADRPMEEITYHWIEGTWTPTSRVIFSYDRPDGEPALVLNQSWGDGAWSDVSKEEWALDAEGRQTTGTAYEWVDGSWSEQMEMVYVYNAEGDKTAARRRSLSDAGITNADSLASAFEGGLGTV